MTEDELIAYYSSDIPVDEALLAPLGLMTWASIRLHHTIRDTIGVELGNGLSDEPFGLTLGSAMGKMVKLAEGKGEPWASAITAWKNGIGQRALAERNRMTHAVAYTADDGKQALTTKPKNHPGQRITVQTLTHAAGLLTLASVRLHEIREACRQEIQR